MTRLLILCICQIVLAVFTSSAKATVFSYIANLNGPSESPPNGSPGTGSAMVEYDNAARTLHIRVNFAGLIGNTTASHIHSATAVPGSGNAGVATTVPSFVGFPLGVTSGTFDNTLDLTMSSSWNPAYVNNNGGTFATAEAALAAGMAQGRAYLNIHTNAYPGGEVRGFLVPLPPCAPVGERDLTLIQAPSGQTVGRCLFAVNADRSVSYYITTQALPGTETTSHLARASHTIIATLPNGSPKVGTTAPLSASDLAAVLEGSAFVDIHTTTTPNGDVRGAILRQGILSSLAESPPADPEVEPDSRVVTFGGGCSECRGIWPHSGEFRESVVDFRIPGRGLDFVWARSYSSRHRRSSAMGSDWDFSYNIRVVERGPDIELFDGNGRRDRFIAQSGSTWSNDERFDFLSRNADGSYVLLFPSGGMWRFFALDGTSREGRISRIEDRNGNALTFSYNASGQLTTINDTLDRNITVEYDTLGYITRVTDFAGRRVTYGHDETPNESGICGNLTSATTPAVTGTPNQNDFPAGKTTTYAYNGSAGKLLRITDSSGHVFLENTYSAVSDPTSPSYGRVTRQTFGRQDAGAPGDHIDFTYVALSPDSGNNFAVAKAIVNDRVGNVREYFYDAMRRLVMKREFTGRADSDQPTTDTTNRPGQRLRPGNPPIGDPPYFETRFAYNASALVTGIVYPNGNTDTFTYDEGNASRRSQGNLIQHCRNRGLVPGDQDFICGLFDYDDAFNFVTDSTDARGNHTVHQYDPRGNRIHTQHRIAGIEENWEYNGHGQLTAHVLPANGSGWRRRDAYTYHATGPQNGYLAAQTIDANGFALTTQYQYDAVGNVIRVIDPKNNATDYFVNQLNQTVREQSRYVASPNALRYETLRWFDANNNVVRVDVENRDETGALQPNTHFSTLFEYEILNCLTRTTQEVDATHSIVTENAYDANRNVILARSGEAVTGRQPNNVVAILYDERDLLFRATRAPIDPNHSTTQFDYDGNGNRVRTSEGIEDVPRVATTAFDGFNRAISTTDAMGNVTTQHYDSNGNMDSQRIDGEIVDLPGSTNNIRLSETTYAYDEMDRLRFCDEGYFVPQTQAPIDGGHAITETRYARNSQVIETIDANAHSTMTVYDTANRTSIVTDPKGNSVAYTYDENANVVQTVETEQSDLGNPAQSYTTLQVFDGLDRLVGVTNNGGCTMEFFHDSRGNVTKTSDARRATSAGAGNMVHYDFDGLNRLVATRRMMTDNGMGNGQPIGMITTRQAWDDNSRIGSRMDDNLNTTEYVYDALNRQTAINYADCTHDQTQFDVHDNPRYMTDANGSLVTTEFDLVNRPAHRAIVPGAGVANTTTFENFQYDGLSRLIIAENDVSLVTRTYDSHSNMAAETQQMRGGPLRTVASVFDRAGNKTRLTYPGGRVVSTSFDSLDRESTIYNGPNPVTSPMIAHFDYIGPSRVECKTMGNNVRADFGYDSNRRLASSTHRYDPNGQNVMIDDRRYDWDCMDNKVMRADVRAGGAQIVHHTSFDSVNRLSHDMITDASSNVEDTRWMLDGVGNRTSVVGGPDAGSYAMDGVACAPPGDRSMNQYSKTPFDQRRYDANGNLVSFGSCLGGDVNTDGTLNAQDIPPFVDALLGVMAAGCADLNFDGSVDGADIQLFEEHLSGASVPALAKVAAYDYLNRLTQHEDAMTRTSATYAYDALGRQIESVTSDDREAGPLVVLLLYDGESELETRGDQGELIKTNIWSDNELDGLVWAFQTGQQFFVVGDRLYRWGLAADGSGVVLRRFEYTTHGAPTITDSQGTQVQDPIIDHLGAGMRWDPGLGWYWSSQGRGFHMKGGFYDPRVGRRVERAPEWAGAESLGNGYVPDGIDVWERVSSYGWSDMRRWDLDEQTRSAFLSAEAQAIAWASEWQEADRRATASTELGVCSFVADCTPFVGTIKSAVQLVTGNDLVSGEEVSRPLQILGLIPFGKLAGKSGKFVRQLLGRSEKVVLNAEAAILDGAINSTKAEIQFSRALVNQAAAKSALGSETRLVGTRTISELSASEAARIRTGEALVIGKMDDLKAPLTRAAAGESTLLARLPNRGTRTLNRAQNLAVLYDHMRKGLPIRDASVNAITGALESNSGFLRLERALLRRHGWWYDPATRLWMPPR